MKTKTEIVNPSDSRQQVTVVLDATTSEEPQVFHNTAAESLSDIGEPIVRGSPYLTHQAVESACMSGAFYARHKLDVAGVAVELISYIATEGVENALPFTVAATIGICEAIAGPTEFSEKEMWGWRLLRVERQL